MNEELNYLTQKCREAAPHFTGNIILEMCQKAAEQQGQARIRITSYCKRKMKPPSEGGRNLSWSDLRDALLTAKVATWQEDHGRWMVTGGLDNDGEPLTVIVMVTLDSDDVYAWNAFGSDRL